MPNLPGCVAAASTSHAVLAEIRAAIQFHLEGLVVQGLRRQAGSSPRAQGTTPPLKLVANRGVNDSVQAVQNPEQPLNAPLQLQAHHRAFEAAGIGEARGFPEPEHAVEAVAQFFDLKRS